MKKKIAIGAVLIALLLAGVVLWYTRPRSFLAITGTSENAVCSAALLLLESWVDDGQARHDNWGGDRHCPRPPPRVGRPNHRGTTRSKSPAARATPV